MIIFREMVKFFIALFLGLGFVFILGNNNIFAQGTFECLCIPDASGVGGCSGFQATAIKCDSEYIPNISLCRLDAQVFPCVTHASVTVVPWGGACDPNSAAQVCDNNTICHMDSHNVNRCLFSDGYIQAGQQCQDTKECFGYNDVQAGTQCGTQGGIQVCQSQQQGQLCSDYSASASCKASCADTQHSSPAIDCLNSTPVCCVPNPPPSPGAGGSISCSGGTSINTAIGCISYVTRSLLIGFLLKWGIGIVGGIAFLLILVAGFQILTSRGDPTRLQAGQELMTSAIMGVLMLILSLVLLRIIGYGILGIPFFQ